MIILRVEKRLTDAEFDALTPEEKENGRWRECAVITMPPDREIREYRACGYTDGQLPCPPLPPRLGE